MLALLAMNALSTASFYIGTYTGPAGSKGIYQSSLDLQSGQLSELKLIAEAKDPSFVALHPNGRFVYSVHESTAGDVSSYSVAKDGTLNYLNSAASNVGGPCHLTVDPSGRGLFVAGYGGGALASVSIREDGSLGELVSLFKNSGNGPDKSRQESPHMHSVLAKGDKLFACDLGTDELLIFKLKDLMLGGPTRMNTAAGGGPRHLVLSKDGRYAYVNNEMGNSVSLYDLEAGNNPRQTISCLPIGEPTVGKTTAEIVLHPSGRWLYVSNRGHNSIAVFSLAADGRLERLEVAPCGVRQPRGFDVDPTGRWLVVAGQESNNLVSLAIDQDTGRLTVMPQRVQISKPVCVLFAR